MDQTSNQFSAEKSRVALFSLLASGVLALAKFVAAALSGSLGLLSEAVHSLLDLGATALTLFAIRYADQPADDDHHFGHAKIESVAALIETALLFLVTGWIAFEAATRLIGGGHDVRLSWWVFAVVIASIVIDLNRSRALQRTSDKTSSEALAADALHFRADMWSSAAVLAGLALTWAGLPFGDPLAALVVAGFVAKAGYDLGRRTLATLLDAAPAGVAKVVGEAAQGIDGVLSVSQLRIRPAGPTLFIDVSVDIPRTLPVARIVEIKEELTRLVRAKHPSADVTVAANPVALDDETAFEKISLIAAQHRAAIHHVTVQDVHGRLAISFDYEVDGATSLTDAHEEATILEHAIRDGIDGDVEVESHIEPRPMRKLVGVDAGATVEGKVARELAKLAKREKLLSDLHNIRVRKTESGLFVHYHCRFAPATSIAAVHEVVDRIENALLARIAGVNRVIAHAEPVGRARHGV